MLCVYCSISVFSVTDVLYVSLQYFDTVGWVFWPVKTVSHITKRCWRGRKTLLHPSIHPSISLCRFPDLHTLLYEKRFFQHTIQCQFEGEIFKKLPFDCGYCSILLSDCKFWSCLLFVNTFWKVFFEPPCVLSLAILLLLLFSITYRPICCHRK